VCVIPAIGDYNDNPHIDCFQTWSDSNNETAQNITFDGNYCENLNQGMYAFMLAGGANHLIIRNNIIKAFGGINTGKTGQHHLYIYNNLWVNDLSFGSQGYPIAISLKNAPFSFVKNNIFYNQPYQTIIAIGDTTGQEIDYNLAYNSDGSNADCMRVGNYVCANPPASHDQWNVDPRFINPGIPNYHLQPGSPAIGSGVAVSVTNDFDGNPRFQLAGYDIGAFVIQITPSFFKLWLPVVRQYLSMNERRDKVSHCLPDILIFLFLHQFLSINIFS
jgi:hypothetical protein